MPSAKRGKVLVWVDGRVMEDMTDPSLYFRPWYVHGTKLRAFIRRGANNWREAMVYASTQARQSGHTLWVSTLGHAPTGGWPLDDEPRGDPAVDAGGSTTSSAG